MKNIAIITGGYSGESIISRQSAETVLHHLDASRYKSYIIDISHEGWFWLNGDKKVFVEKNDFSISHHDGKINFDAVFVALHGSPGEDGKIQGYFDALSIPYTSGGVFNLSLTFNKHKTAAVLRALGFQVASAVLVRKGEDRIEEIANNLGFPCFIKPNEGGSSLGASKVNSIEELPAAIKKGFLENGQVLAEEYIEGVEITCGVAELDGEITALPVTEVVITNEFFDFDAKYHSKETQEITPARISSSAYDLCQKTSLAIYKSLDCSGIVRMDYFLLKDGTLNVIEVNTVPGLSTRSFIPQQAEYAQISLKKLFGDAIEQCLNCT